MARRRNVGILQLQAIGSGPARRLIREAGGMERSIQPVSRTIAGKHTPCSIRTMRSRREPYDQ
jgi:hypothetical protein